MYYKYVNWVNFFDIMYDSFYWNPDKYIDSVGKISARNEETTLNIIQWSSITTVSILLIYVGHIVGNYTYAGIVILCVTVCVCAVRSMCWTKWKVSNRKNVCACVAIRGCFIHCCGRRDYNYVRRGQWLYQLPGRKRHGLRLDVQLLCEPAWHQ